MTAVGWMRAPGQITMRSPTRGTSGESWPWISLDGRPARISSRGSPSRAQGAAGSKRAAKGSGSWAKSGGIGFIISPSKGNVISGRAKHVPPARGWYADDIVRAGVSRFRPFPKSFYRRPAETVARDLLGRYLVRELDGERLVLRLVETEAFLGDPDRATHAWAGRRTPRNESLYLPGGYAYVYMIYGMHFCLNAVTGEADAGGAVLLRGGEPVEGEERMRENRSWARAPRPGDLAGGPGKICQALAIGRELDGAPLEQPPLYITRGEPIPEEEIIASPRIGVDYAVEAALWPLRFSVRGHPHVSRPRPV